MRLLRCDRFAPYGYDTDNLQVWLHGRRLEHFILGKSWAVTLADGNGAMGSSSGECTHDGHDE